jgi:cardiolipin synthase
MLRFLPNLITGLRILLIPPFLWLLLQGSYGGALALFLLAAASDGVDGLLARRYGWRSRLGAVLDPLADKLLMLCAYLALGWLAALPWWLVGLVLLRDGLIVAGALAYYRLFGICEMAPLPVSKLNTLLQSVLVLAVLGALWQGEVSPPPLRWLTYLVAATTLASGAGYVWIWSRRALAGGREQ